MRGGGAGRKRRLRDVTVGGRAGEDGDLQWCTLGIRAAMNATHQNGTLGPERRLPFAVLTYPVALCCWDIGSRRKYLAFRSPYSMSSSQRGNTIGRLQSVT